MSRLSIFGSEFPTGKCRLAHFGWTQLGNCVGQICVGRVCVGEVCVGGICVGGICVGEVWVGEILQVPGGRAFPSGKAPFATRRARHFPTPSKSLRLDNGPAKKQSTGDSPILISAILSYSSSKTTLSILSRKLLFLFSFYSSFASGFRTRRIERVE